MRNIVITVILLISILILGYWLSTTVPNYLLGFHHGSQWTTLASGWAIYLHGWFFFLPGIVLAFVVVSSVALFFYDKAFASDYQDLYEAEKQRHNAMHEDLMDQIQSAHKRAAEAEETAKQALSDQFTEARQLVLETQQKMAEAQSIKTRAYQQIQQAQQIEQAANTVVAEAKQTIAELQKETRRAQKKQANASAAVRRIKQRAQKELTE